MNKLNAFRALAKYTQSWAHSTEHFFLYWIINMKNGYAQNVNYYL